MPTGWAEPYSALAQAFRVRLDAQQARWVWKHRPRAGLREALAAQHLEQHLGVAPAHIGIVHAFGRRVTEVAPAVDDLLR